MSRDKIVAYDILLKLAAARQGEDDRPTHEESEAAFAEAEGLSADDLAFVAELAALGRLAYGHARKDAAKRLKIGVAALDGLVKGYREATAEPSEHEPSTQADVLVGIAGRAQLFHTAEGVAYADIEVDGHRETWMVASKGFRDWLTHEYFKATKAAPAGYGMQAALGLVEARARFDAPTREVYLRTARVDGKIYLDLCDDAWRAVEVDRNGWRIVAAPPVRFRRARGMLPLPAPERGGSVDDLRKFINVQRTREEVDPTTGQKTTIDDDAFVLVVGWELGALGGVGPYAVLVVCGEHGSAKTFTGWVLRAVIDPNKVPQRALPRHDHDLYIAGGNALVLAFDNISKLPDWLSDTLCRLSTGGGFAARELYTDADEKLFDGMRPLMLNGIEDFVVRPDLGDRSIVLVLDKIAGDERRTEAALRKEFEEARPKILGALLDAAANGLAVLEDTTLAELPRMADFALWVAACENGGLWAPGTFEQAYEKNQKRGQIALLDTDAVAAAIKKLALEPPSISVDGRAETHAEREARKKRGGTMWSGTATALLDLLNKGSGEVGATYAEEETRRDQKWPGSAWQLSGRLRRMAPALRLVGIEITFDRASGESKITIATKPGPAKPAQEGLVPEAEMPF